MTIPKDMDSINFHMKFSKKFVKVYYKGERYLPVLNHPTFGVYDQDEEDNSFKLPERYAETLINSSPTIFSLERDNKSFYDEEFKGSAGFAKLIQYAKKRGVTIGKGVKKKDLIESLLDLDEEEKSGKLREKPEIVDETVQE